MVNQVSSVEHDAQRQRFFVGDSEHGAHLDYQRVAATDGGADWVDFYHTYVPEAYRGAGVAAHLTAAALAFAKQQSWRIRASCSYVALYLQRHPLL